MKNEKYAKYLWNFLSEEGFAQSVQLTIDKRKGIVERANYDVQSILSDCRYRITGGLVSGFDVCEIAIIPTLIYNSETWQETSKKSIDYLEKLQLKFLRSVLAVGAVCPIPL